MSDIIVDLRRVQEADDGDTTWYGGWVTVGSVDLQAKGCDRDWKLERIICNEVQKQFGLPDGELLEDLPMIFSPGIMVKLTFDGATVTQTEM